MKNIYTNSLPTLLNRKRRGSVLVMYMLMLSTLLTGAVASVAVLSNAASQSTSIGFDRAQAFYAAEAGIQRAIWNIKYNSTNFTSNITTATTGNVWTNGPTYILSCSTSNPNWPTSSLGFQCVGTSADGLVTSQASATIGSPGNCPGLATGKDFTCNGTMNIGGDFEVLGNVIRNGNTTLTAANGQGGSLKATGNFSINGSTNVSGDFMFNGTVKVNGPTTIAGNLSAGNNPSSGNVLTGNGALTVSGNATVAGQISTGGAVNITGNLQTPDSPSYSGTFNVGGTENVQATNGPNLSITIPTVDTTTLINEAIADGTVTTLTNGQTTSVR